MRVHDYLQVHSMGLRSEIPIDLCFQSIDRTDNQTRLIMILLRRPRLHNRRYDHEGTRPMLHERAQWVMYMPTSHRSALLIETQGQELR